MKKLIVLVLTLVCMLGAIGCDGKINMDSDMSTEQQQLDKPTEQHQFNATILEIYDNHLLVEPCSGMDELKSSDKIEVSIQNIDKSIEWKVGDYVLITYDGIILETYPARLNQVYKVEKGAPQSTENETQPGGTPVDELFDITVSYANWGELTEIYAKALNTEKMAMSSVIHLPIYKFDTLAELEQFKNDVKDVLSIEQGYDEVPSFNESTAKYDESFFTENTLMLVYVEATSGSYRYGVDSIYHADGNFCIHIKQTNNPEIHSDDMSGWFITVAVPDSMVADCTVFDADIH